MSTFSGNFDLESVTGFAGVQDLLNALNVACWGDSLTMGTSGNPNYPTAVGNATGYGIYNGGVSSETSTQIKVRFLADTAKHGWTTIIWAGRNNFSDPTTVKADIADMVAALGHDRYLILGVVNGDYAAEWAGGASYATIVQLNSDLAAIYGAHFLDVRSFLVAAYNPSIPQDVIDHGHDVPPSSLRNVGDALHYNTAGYAQVAAMVLANLSTLQGTAGKVLAVNNAVALLNFFRQNPSFIGALVSAAGATFAGNLLLSITGTAQCKAEGTTGAYHVVSSPLGQQQGFAWQRKGVGNLWTFYQTASSLANLELKAYDDAGHVIDTVLALSRAAGSPISVGRPVILPAGTAASAPLRLIPGVAPTTPQDGHVWLTSAGLFYQANGVTVGPLA